MITDGLKLMIDEMGLNQSHVKTFSVGGAADGGLGTNPIAIYETIEANADDNAILIFTDMGSAILSAEAAIDMLDEGIKSKVHLVDSPLVEGAFIAAVQSDGSADVAEIIEELKQL